MGDSKTMDVDDFYEKTSEALEEIADEDDGRKRTAAEWLALLGQKLNASASDDEDSDDGEDESDEDGDGED